MLTQITSQIRQKLMYLCNNLSFMALHNSVGGSSSSFGNCPPNKLLRRFDGAAFAVHAVLRVDNEFLFTLRILLRVFIDTSGAKSLLRAGVFGDGYLTRHVSEVRLDSKVRRLVVLVKSTYNHQSSIIEQCIV